MIIQQQTDPMIVIRQTDHAFLASYFARELGNEGFVRPEPFSAFCAAVAEHDNGWRDWELCPGVDPKSLAPYTFMSVPTEEHIALYQRGLERLAAQDPYAALLVSLHCMGLYDRAKATMPGFSAKYVKAHEQHHANDFVQKLRLQQLRWKVDLRGEPLFKEFVEEKRLKANAQLLEALDRLSLFFCLGGLDGMTIESVPVDSDGSEVDWEVHKLSDTEFTIAPYPFRREPLEFAILARRIPNRRYADEADLNNALSPAGFFNLKFTLRRAEGFERGRAAGMGR